MKRSETLLKMYELLLELSLPGLSTQLKKSPRAFNAAFDYWLNNTINNIIEKEAKA